MKEVPLPILSFVNTVDHALQLLDPFPDLLKLVDCLCVKRNCDFGKVQKDREVESNRGDGYRAGYLESCRQTF